MVQVTQEQLDQLEHIKTGGYGSVYRVDDHTAYKIYRPDFYGPDGNVMVNPSLQYPNPRLALLKINGRNLKYTNVFSDYIFKDGFFAGVVITFYDGKQLYHLKDFSFPQKYSASKQMVRNGKELDYHFIYPRDYKLENMIMDLNGVVWFFDLDDIATKVFPFPNLFRSLECRYGLSETIQTLFDEDPDRPYKIDVRKALTRRWEPLTPRFSKMLEYIERKNEEHRFVVVDENSDYSRLQEFLGSYPYSILYRLPLNSPNNDDSFYFQIIQKLKEMGFPIYDFLRPFDLVEDYSNNFHTVDSVELKGKEFVKAKK